MREQGDTFTLISVCGGDAFLLNSTPEIRILPLNHFYDAFCAASMRDLHPEGSVHADIAGDSVDEVPVALAERVGDFNVLLEVGATLAPDCDCCPGIYSATTLRHCSSLLWVPSMKPAACTRCSH